MSFTASDLAAVEAALKSGTRRVRYTDREVEYRSLEELVALRATINAELNAGTAQAHTYPRHQLASFADD